MPRVPWKPLATAGLDTALVLLGSMASLALLLPVLLVAADMSASRRCISWDLTVPWKERATAEPLRRAIEEAVAAVEPPPLVSLREAGVASAIEVCPEPAGRARERVFDLVTGSGLSSGGFTIELWDLTPWLAEGSSEPLVGPVDLAEALAAKIGVWVYPATSLPFVLAAILLRRLRPSPGWEGGRRRRSQLLAIGFGVGALASAGSAVLEALQGLLGVEVEEQAWIVDLAAGGPGGLAVLTFVGVVLAPLAEELFFRGHLFRYLAWRGEVAWAYAFSAGVFAVLHVNPSATLLYLWLGALFAWSYHRWRSLLVPVVAHATSNALAILLLALGGA